MYIWDYSGVLRMMDLYIWDPGLMCHYLIIAVAASKHKSDEVEFDTQRLAGEGTTLTCHDYALSILSRLIGGSHR